MGDPTEYRIETVTDMLKVPRDKWPAMLEDVKAWLELCADMQDLVDAGLMQIEPCVQWFDDDIAGLSQISLEVVESLGADRD